jgi:hypothetical protein
MRTGANYSLWMVGRQARHGRSTCVQNIYPERGLGPWREALWGGRSRRCQNGATLNTLSLGMLTTRFLFPKFFPKKFGQKIGAGPPTGNFGNGLCADPVLLHPAPPFLQMKNTPRGSFPEGRISRRGIRPSLGLVTSFMPGSATFLPHLTIRLPAYEAIAGVEAWAAGGIWRSAEWAFRQRISWRAGPGCGCNYQPMRRCGAACG